MTTINLFKPGKLNAYLQFPAAWDELLPGEVIEICRQQLLAAQNVATAKAAILYFILQNRAKLQKVKLPAGWIKMIDAEDMVINGYGLIDFIYAGNNLTTAPENRIKLAGILPRVVYGPNEGFQNITCGEFEDAEIYFHQFFEKPDPEPLARLAATLWRPAKWLRGQSARLPYITKKNGTFKTYKAETLYPKFLKLSPWRLYSVFVWYHGSRNQLPELFPTVHKNSGGSADEPDIMAFTKCIHAGAGPKNGSRYDIRMSKLLEFFFEMEQEASKAEELKEEYEKLKNT